MGIEVGFSIPTKVVIEVLKDYFRVYGIPKIIRTDQRPEFRSINFEKFIRKYGICHKFIEKGSPWENGTLESLHNKLRDECLKQKYL